MELEQFKKLCEQAGVTAADWTVEDGEECITWEGIKKVREFCAREKIKW